MAEQCGVDMPATAYLDLSPKLAGIRPATVTAVKNVVEANRKRMA